MRRDDSTLPLYHRIYVSMRQEIIGGAYVKGERLPAETTLKDRFGVARVTVRSAMARLESEGLVSRQPGRGTVCTYDTGVEQQGLRPIRGMIENLIAMGLETTVCLLRSDYIEPACDILENLNLLPGERVHHAVRVRKSHGKPMSHLTTYIPESIAVNAKFEQLGSRPLLLLLEESGQIVTEADQWITACGATPEVACHLDVEEGTPLLSLTRMVYARDRQPVELLHALYRPDMYNFALSLERQRGVKTGQWVPMQ